VARCGELDGRRSSALGHEPLQGRVDRAVLARNRIPRRHRVPGSRPGWCDEEREARGALLRCDLGAQLRIQILGEVLSVKLGVDDEEGEPRRGEQQMLQKRPRCVANAHAGDRLTALRGVGRRVDQSTNVAASAGGVGDYKPAVGVTHENLVPGIESSVERTAATSPAAEVRSSIGVADW